MCCEKKSSSLVISIIAALVFGLVMAVFGTSQATGLLKPETGDQLQISNKSHNVRVVINKMSPKDRFRVVCFNDHAVGLTKVFLFGATEEDQKVISLVKRA